MSKQDANRCRHEPGIERLGSGGGIDVLLSARRVGPTGRAFTLDMTDPMLALVEENQRRSGLTTATACCAPSCGGR